MECPRCRALLDQRRKGEGEAPPEETPLQRLSGVDYDDILEKVLHRIQLRVCAAERDRAEAPALFAELMRHPPERREILVRNSGRFRNFTLCELLLRASREESSRSPDRAERLARLALLIAERLDPERLGAEPLEDTRARCWALVGNARRAASDLHGAEQAFQEAEAHLRQGTRDRMERAIGLALKASLRRAQRRFSEAVRLLRRALSIWLAAGETRRAVEAMLAWALVHREAGELERAIRILGEARALCGPDDLFLNLSLRHDMAACFPPFPVTGEGHGC
jgi:tetratricopeptide (TPR) repeat protein